jgi:hypothetical protein
MGQTTASQLKSPGLSQGIFSYRKYLSNLPCKTKVFYGIVNTRSIFHVKLRFFYGICHIKGLQIPCEIKLAAIVGSEILTRKLNLPRPIIMTELDALLMGIERALTVSSKGLPRYFKPVVKVFTDSQVALWFVRRGTARYDWSTSDLTNRILRWNALRRLICVDCEYVKSEENPADYYSRYE